MISNKKNLIPYYRMKEITNLYNVFCDEYKNELNLNYRKNTFKNIVKLKYNWLTNSEYNYIYENIKENEYNIIINFKKIQIETNFKKDLIKLFVKFDTNNNNSIDINEFKNILSKINIYTDEEIKKIFCKADINNDNEITIDEFIIFLAKNDELADKLKSIIDCKNEIRKNNDKRTLLFNNFPGSPLKHTWQPSLFNLNSLDEIKKKFNNLK